MRVSIFSMVERSPAKAAVIRHALPLMAASNSRPGESISLALASGGIVPIVCVARRFQIAVHEAKDAISDHLYAVRCPADDRIESVSRVQSLFAQSSTILFLECIAKHSGDNDARAPFGGKGVVCEYLC